MSTHEHEEEEVGRIVENMAFAIDAADDSKTLSPSLPAEYAMEIGGDDNAVELDLVDASTTPGDEEADGTEVENFDAPTASLRSNQELFIMATACIDRAYTGMLATRRNMEVGEWIAQARLDGVVRVWKKQLDHAKKIHVFLLARFRSNPDPNLTREQVLEQDARIAAFWNRLREQPQHFNREEMQFIANTEGSNREVFERQSSRHLCTGIISVVISIGGLILIFWHPWR